MCIYRSPQCIICKDFHVAPIYNFNKSRLNGGIPGLVFKCYACGMFFKKYNINILDVYSNIRHLSGIQEYMTGDVAYKFFNTVLSHPRFYKRLAKRNPKLLDIGTGLGAMMEVASNLGFKVEGVEISHELAFKAKDRGFVVHIGKIEELELNRQYDVITMMDVIEHLPNPIEVLNKIYSLLVPGGRLIIYTPNHQALIVKIAQVLNNFGLGKPLENIFATNHVSFFNLKTLKLALKMTKFQIDDVILKPYNPYRPGAPISVVSLYVVAFIEYLGYVLTRSGFRLLVYASAI